MNSTTTRNAVELRTAIAEKMARRAVFENHHDFDAVVEIDQALEDLFEEMTLALPKRTLIAEWQEPTYTAETRVVALDHFGQDVGYEAPDIWTVIQLDVGGSAWLGSDHRVTRTA